MAIPVGLTISQILSLANTKDAPYLKRRRVLSNKRTLYCVRSDFLIHYTDIWYRNRYPDTERVNQIMKSIEDEGEPDNRIYLAYIKGITKLMCFDGNHRREALIRLYYVKGFTCWIDIDILTDVDDTDVVSAFRRINLGVSVPEIYIEGMSAESNIPIAETSIYTCEEFIADFKEKWPFVIVDKNKTRSPYCTKNNFIEMILPHLKNNLKSKELMNIFDIIHSENKNDCKVDTITTRVCRGDIDCFIFFYGFKHVKIRLDYLIKIV